MKKEVKEELITEIITSSDAHIKKYGFRKMSMKELERLCATK